MTPSGVKFELLRCCTRSVHDDLYNGVQTSGYFTFKQLSGRGMPGNKGCLDLYIYLKQVLAEFPNVMRKFKGLAPEDMTSAFSSAK